jgi:hypothetical protein
MKKLTREEMKAVNAGTGGGGGGGEVVCNFLTHNAACGDLCYDVNSYPAYYQSCAAAWANNGFNPSCQYYGYVQVTQCPGY